MVAGYLARAERVGGTRGSIGDAVMLVGQAPGHLSVERSKPFSGPGGRVLDGWLRHAGFAGRARSRVYLSAMTRCDPGKNPSGSGDRKPSPAEVALCRPYLLGELALVRPQVILPAGGMAIEAFLGPQRLEAVIGQAFERNGGVAPATASSLGGQPLAERRRPPTVARPGVRTTGAAWRELPR